MDFPHSRDRFRLGERFVYRGYECQITWDGIKPHFEVDGEDAEEVFPDFEVTAQLDPFGYDFELMEAIDVFEGEDTDSNAYIPPKERLTIRSFGRKFIFALADETGSYYDAHAALNRSEHTVVDVYREVWARIECELDARSDDDLPELLHLPDTIRQSIAEELAAAHGEPTA